MSQRLTRVNELLKRELSHQLHESYRDDAVYITITEVVTSPDLRNAIVYYSVIGDDKKKKEAKSFLLKKRNELKNKIAKHVTIKYLPSLEFRLDPSLETGARMWRLIDQIEGENHSE